MLGNFHFQKERTVVTCSLAYFLHSKEVKNNLTDVGVERYIVFIMFVTENVADGSDDGCGGAFRSFGEVRVA